MADTLAQVKAASAFRVKLRRAKLTCPVCKKPLDRSAHISESQGMKWLRCLCEARSPSAPTWEESLERWTGVSIV